MNSRAGKEYHGHKLVTLTLNYVSKIRLWGIQEISEEHF